MTSGYLRLLVAVVASSAFAFSSTDARDQCGNLIKSINFEGDDLERGRLPYTEELAHRDWAPFTYLDGFHGDPNTRASNNRRAFEVETDQSTALEVLLPKGCVTGECAMQAKHRLLTPVDSATLKFKMKFGPDFDWVNGGKLPGLCGAECLTGCKPVTGLDGFSSRQMWRPCVWPPENELNEINCSGGKLVAYVYHMNRDHWCGDDFEYSNDLWAREYTTPKSGAVQKNFLQPNADEWYTVWSHIQMNTAGPPDEPAGEPIRDGKLQTWLQIAGQEPLLVVDQQNMGWRVYNNVSIDTMYFSVFFGGSSDKFKASKDETILFDDIQVWEGRCAPENEPFSQDLLKALPEWDSQIFDRSPSALGVRPLFETASLGGGCARIEISNGASAACTKYQVQLSVRPSWGFLDSRRGEWLIRDLDLIDADEDAGWYLLESDDDPIQGKETVERASFCVRNFASAQYLPEDLYSHVVARAFCVAGPAVELQGRLTADAVESTLAMPRTAAEKVPPPPPPAPAPAPAPVPIVDPPAPALAPEAIASAPSPAADAPISVDAPAAAAPETVDLPAAAPPISSDPSTTTSNTPSADGSSRSASAGGTLSQTPAQVTSTDSGAEKKGVTWKVLVGLGTAFIGIAVIVGLMAARHHSVSAAIKEPQDSVPDASSPKSSRSETSFTMKKTTS